MEGAALPAAAISSETWLFRSHVTSVCRIASSSLGRHRRPRL